MKRLLSAMRYLIPAAVVIVLMLCCASMPELAEVPARLSAMEASAESQGDTAEASSESSGSDNEEEEAVQAVGDYTDGVYTGSATGYGGIITVQVTVEDSQIADVEVLSHEYETDSFFNRALAVIDSILLYQTWEVDAISGATYSSNGIKYAVQNALTGDVTETETAETSTGDTEALTSVSYEDPDSYIDGTYTGSAAGYGGTITVSVTISGGKITSITVVSAPGETASYLASAESVISAIISAQSPNVDTVAGATYSSNGIINAVKNALSKASGSSSEEEENEEDEEAEVDYSSLPNYGYVDGTYTGTASGYGGEVSLSVTISGGQITDITVLSAEGETYAYWQQALTLLDTIIEEQTWEVDVVSGATYSSNGIINAVKEALSKASASSSEEEEDEEAEADSSSLPNYGYVDGTYTGTASGYGGEVSLSVTVSGGQITDITVLSAEGETYAYWQQALTLLDTIIEEQTWEVDVVSGATYSSNGIINAVKEALSKASASSGEEEEEEEDEEAEADYSSLPNYGYVDGTYTGTASGYGGEVSLSVTVSGGQITDITVLSAEGETYAYWQQALTLLDTIIEEQTWEVDVVSGATYSSNGIINAVQNALNQTDESSEEEEEEEDDKFSGLPNYGYSDGTYIGTGEGYGGEVTLSVTVSGGQIVDITVVSAEEETYAYWQQALTLLDTIIELQTWEVDVVSGATYSSEGILGAVEDALAGEENTDGSSDAGAGSSPDEEAAEDADSDSAGQNTENADSSSGEEAGSSSEEDAGSDAEEETLVETEVSTEVYSGTATVYPDDDEDFDPYTFTLSITVQTTVTTETGEDEITVTTTREIMDAEYSTDTSTRNQRYLLKAWEGMIDSLTAGESVDDVDTVSGATCSSSAILEAWSGILGDVLLGTETVTTELADSSAEGEESTDPESGEPEEAVDEEASEDGSQAESEGDQEEEAESGEETGAEETDEGSADLTEQDTEALMENPDENGQEGEAT